MINCATAAKSLATEGILPLLLTAYKVFPVSVFIRSPFFFRAFNSESSLECSRILALHRSIPQRAETYDEKHNCRQALQAVMRRCQVVGPLEPLVSSVTPREILVDVMDELAKLLPRDPCAKRSFVASGKRDRSI